MADNKNLKIRQPIVVVMGHVDHGKTTLLDFIRKKSHVARAASSKEDEPRSVAEREAGGITQAVGAYEIEHNGKKMTFIDTPGHEAFSKMRTRGATAADLAVLVVSAEEGVKLQTKEAIKTIKETKTPFVVAINKIDRPGADVEKTKNDLMQAEVFLEGFGGNVSFQPISAKTGDGVSELLDLLLLTAEVEHFTYDPAAPANGYVLETMLNRARGNEAVVIIKDGTLKRGVDIATESAKGQVKMLENFLGKIVPEAHGGAPAIIVGFETLPKAGEFFATGLAAIEIFKGNEKKRTATALKEDALKVVLKASDAGSLEALSEIVRAMKLEKPVLIIDESVGEVGENDVKLAVSSSAIIIGFKSKADKAAKALAEAQGVKVILSDIVYDLTRAIEVYMEESKTSDVIGTLEVLAVFNQKKLDSQLVGGKVIQGGMRGKGICEIVRVDSAHSTSSFDKAQDKSGQAGQANPSQVAKVVAGGRVLSLRQGKDTVGEVREGKEAGIVIQSTEKILVGDKIVLRVKREVEK
ncbi:MAG: GTP-binding protein [bacterium]|nr:GTP-binding protein [bacterium]